MPGSPQGAALHTDNDAIRTSAEHIEDAPGSGVERWLKFIRAADGAIVGLGAKADAAVTNPANDGTVVALLKGVLTFVRKSGTGILKDEDDAHASGDSGVMTLAVRSDTAAASSGTDGDYEPLHTDALGRLRVTVPAIPEGGTAVTGASGNKANASAVATLAAGGAGVRTYITGLTVTAAGATAALAVNVTVGNTITADLTLVYVFPAGVAVAGEVLVVTFPQPIPADADNTAVTVTLPASGAGGTHAAVTAHGFQL